MVISVKTLQYAMNSIILDSHLVVDDSVRSTYDDSRVLESDVRQCANAPSSSSV